MINNTHKKICDAVVEYLRENRKFERKHFKTSAVRSRNALFELIGLIKQRRKEILAEKKALPVKHNK